MQVPRYRNSNDGLYETIHTILGRSYGNTKKRIAIMAAI